MFIGVDISGSFMKSQYYEDSIAFTAQYLYSHLQGMGGLEVPHSLFVGSIGGYKKDEPKTMYPIQSFEQESLEGIHKKLKEIFPVSKANSFTDFNAYFEQVAETIQNKKLLLKPISIVMLTDGKPDLPGKDREKFKKIKVHALENLSRNVTLRVLYPDAITSKYWTDHVPRKRVKIWTQDAPVMVEWKNPSIFQPRKPASEQARFYKWILDNVDFNARTKRVD